MKTWIRALGKWLWEARLAWLGVGTLLAAFLFLTAGGLDEPRTRIVGLALQLLGVGTVAWGIRQTRRLFDRPRLARTFRGWLSRFPRSGGRTIAVAGSATLSAVGARARGHVTENPTNASVSARLDALEKNIAHVHERISGLQAEFDQSASEHREALEAERQARKGHDRELRERLELTETGGLHLSAIGTLWLAVGIILSTAAPELAEWLQ